MGDRLDQFVLGEAVVDRTAQVAGELLGAVEGDERGDGDEAAVALGEPGRSQTSPNRTSSVSSTSFGAKSPINCCAGVGCAMPPTLRPRLGPWESLPVRCPLIERRCEDRVVVWAQYALIQRTFW